MMRENSESRCLMKLKVLPEAFSVCKLRDAGNVDLTMEYCFVGKTDEELSLVCTTGTVPECTLAREDGWRGFRIEGVLDFSLIGILARISGILAEAEIGIFVVSTYNTDYIFTKEDQLWQALDALSAAGYQIC